MGRHCCLTSFFLIADTCPRCEDIVQESCAMVPRYISLLLCLISLHHVRINLFKSFSVILEWILCLVFAFSCPCLLMILLFTVRVFCLDRSAQSTVIGSFNGFSFKLGTHGP